MSRGGLLPAPSPSPSTQGWLCPEFPHPQHVWDAEGKLEGRVSFGITTMGFPGGSTGKESACNARDSGSIPGLGRSPGEGNSYPLQYSVLENSMDCIVHGVTKSQTRLSDFHFHHGGRILTKSVLGGRALEKYDFSKQFKLEKEPIRFPTLPEFPFYIF